MRDDQFAVEDPAASVDRVLELARSTEAGELGALSAGSVAALIRVAVFDSAKVLVAKSSD